MPDTEEKLGALPQAAGEPWVSYAAQLAILAADHGQDAAAQYIRDVVRMHGGDLADTLQRIYDSEINIKIETMWDGGYDLSLGGSGYFGDKWKHEWSVEQACEIEPWFRQAFCRFYPAPASAIEARSDATPQSGSTGGESPVPQAFAHPSSSSE